MYVNEFTATTVKVTVLAGDLTVVYSRIGSGAGSGVVHIAETGGQRLHHLPETVGQTDITDRYINSSSGATGSAGNDLLRPPGVGSGEGSGEGSVTVQA